MVVVPPNGKGKAFGIAGRGILFESHEEIFNEV